MKRIYIYLLAIMIIAPSCEEGFLDVNENPNTSSAAAPPLLFTGALNDYSNNRTIDFGTSAFVLSQLWSGGGAYGAGVFTDPEVYRISIFTSGNTWRAHYRNTNKNLNLAIEVAESSDPVQNNAAATAKIFSALTYWSSSMIWGDVPFTEANNPEILNPKFDPQKDVLEGVIDLLDEAIAQIDQDSPLTMGSNDLIYGGDMESWRKFAKSLKFRILMIMVDADPSKASAIAELYDEGDMISSPTENAEFPFFDQPGNKNPIYQTIEDFAGGENYFFFGSQAMVDLMNTLEDPRRAKYFQSFPSNKNPLTAYVGVPPGDDATAIGEEVVQVVISTGPSGSNAIIRPDAPDILLSYSEQLLLEAEAIARGFVTGGLLAADEKYREGITTSLEYYGVSSSEIETYLNSLPALNTLSEDEAIEAIAQQQWIDFIQRPLEGWTNWRRTEVPALELPKGAQTGNLIRRFQYPPDEVAANINAPTQKALDEKMWFDK